MQESLLKNKLKGYSTERPPVWFMRQAGRILPNYQRLKEKYSFQELMREPELAAKVTLMPVYDLGVDAAILFSDILVIPVALGMDLSFTDHGPVFEKPLHQTTNPSRVLTPDASKLDYIYRNIETIVRLRPENIPLIGFCGAPLTTLCYMLQGTARTPNFPDAVKYLYTNKKDARKLIDAITEMSIIYAQNQIRAGVDIFQLFDTHAGLIPAELYMELFWPAIRRISDAVRQMGVPFIFFPKGLGTGIRYITSDVADYVSIDWQMPLRHARELVQQEVGLQGNLDPRLLYAPKEEILATLKNYLPFYREYPNLVINLGHGFLPDIPYENARLVVEWVKSANWSG
ncbi:uroporphyrinogen decarboxylase [Thermophagus xiamenensis]|uniref:Uroporphyrinogen decarboxylase n=1 Tax=Thermophagus xiamenensis TaxID=385682 RepID=A0A1I1YQD9_9BACT|nr:uroporphyrinogen decarboxylase [Thermophagus xiamenensis]SFE21669.1 uroporphyrinogen decarboxylase [Thermophagus xiamenensis]